MGARQKWSAAKIRSTLFRSGCRGIATAAAQSRMEFLFQSESSDRGIHADHGGDLSESADPT
mgnify:CR=1 FL=1|jgi:hypothetical protein